MFVSPPNSYVEILTPIRMVLKGGVFGRWLGHEGGALLMNGISAFVNGTPEKALTPSHVRTQKTVVYEPGNGFS